MCTGGVVASAVICMVMNYPTAWSTARPARNEPNDLVAETRVAVVVVVVCGRLDLARLVLGARGSPFLSLLPFA
jgi:hypothetical protein